MSTGIIQLELPMEVEISNVGARVGYDAFGSGNLSKSDVEDLMRKIAEAGRACQFILGDLINYSIKEKHGEDYFHWSVITGYEPQSLRNIAKTCRLVHGDIRDENLSFRHHEVVSPLEPEKQELWLGVASERKLTKDLLAKSIKLNRVATRDDLAKKDDLTSYDHGTDNPHPHISRLVTLYSKLEREGDLDDMNAEELYRLHLDLHPLLGKYADLVKRMHKEDDEAVLNMLTRDLLNLGIEFHSEDVIDI